MIIDYTHNIFGYDLSVACCTDGNEILWKKENIFSNTKEDTLIP